MAVAKAVQSITRASSLTLYRVKVPDYQLHRQAKCTFKLLPKAGVVFGVRHAALCLSVVSYLRFLQEKCA